MPEHLHGIVVVQAHVAGIVLGECVEQAPDARGVDLDAQVVTVRVAGGGETQCLAVAETDLEHARRMAPEGRIEVAGRAGVIQAEAGPEGIERALLGRREPPLAQHEAADAPLPRSDGERLGRRLGRAFARRLPGHQPTSPSTGEDALA